MTSPQTRTIRVTRSSFSSVGEQYGLPVLLVVIILFFSLLPASSSTFFSSANLSVVLANQSVVMLCALAVMIPLITGNFDFSVGANAVVATMVCAGAQAHLQLPVPVAILMAVSAGALIGLLNGWLVAIVGLDAFITTLGVATALAGLVQWYSGGLAIYGIDPSMIAFGSQTLLGLPMVLYVVIVVFVVIWYVLTWTPFGRRLYAVGSNRRAADLVGIDASRLTFVGFVLAGALAGIAGVLLSARTGGANPSAGTELLFPALAAVFLGATAIRPGRFNAVGTIIGVLFVAVSVSGLTLAGAQSWVDSVFNGVALVIAVFVSTALRRRREGRGR
ncbi:ribose transport system permease protein [Microbacterium endophyticum]|uniref:Ribose transport system permease protein n=1 Tax=Microbacterium endophyticum TaxID=1526412 RepID=A0A7W4V3J1_9MICO|nr:ABC transporter permease [Microbacterium endophyticum]MBB2976161.1 ribose transport system permease protein [Microbacterium endophyticum]NIK36458.1 ribose transport system permease protein [Microbacterium endophyticum]